MCPQISREICCRIILFIKSKKVYLNTIAVYAVHSYLPWLNIKTTLTGDNWHKSLRAIFDATDLEIVQLTSNVGDVFDIRIRTYPSEDETHLPADLHLVILDKTQNPCMKVLSRNIDNWIQLEFSCEHEEKFSVMLILGDTTIKEDFVVRTHNSNA